MNYLKITEEEKLDLDFYCDQNKDINAINMNASVIHQNDKENICLLNCENENVVEIDYSLFKTIEKKKVCLYLLEKFSENLKVLSLKNIDFKNPEIESIFDRLNLKSIKCLSLIDCEFESYQISQLLVKCLASLEHLTLKTTFYLSSGRNYEIGKKHFEIILSIKPETLKLTPIGGLIEANKLNNNNTVLLIQSKSSGKLILESDLLNICGTVYVKHLYLDVQNDDIDSTDSVFAKICENFPNIQTLEIHIHLLTPKCLTNLSELTKLEKLTIIFYHQENHINLIHNNPKTCIFCQAYNLIKFKHFDNTQLDECLIATIDKLRNINECIFKFIRGAIIPFTDKAFKNIARWVKLRNFTIELYEFAVHKLNYENSRLILNSQITNQILFELAKCPIEELKLWHCNIDDNGLEKFIQSNQTIKKVNIINCPKITRLSRELMLQQKAERKMNDKPNIEYLIPLIKFNTFISLKSETNDNYYNVNSEQKGFCFIINNINFKYLKTRIGAEIDAELLKFVFQDLGFEVFYETDFTREQILETLENFKIKIDQNPSEHFAFTFIISSHGEEDAVYAIDEKIHVEEIFSIFNDKNCKGLIGKPKIFIISACRGKRDDDGSPIYSDESNIMLSQVDPLSMDIMGEYQHCNDMLICYASVLGLRAYRLPDSGSVLGDTFANTLIENVLFEDFDNILMNLSESVSKLENSTGTKQSVAVEKRIFKKLKFALNQSEKLFEMNIDSLFEWEKLQSSLKNDRVSTRQLFVEREIIVLNKLVESMKKASGCSEVVEILEQINSLHDENERLSPFAWKSGEIQVLLNLIKSSLIEDKIDCGLSQKIFHLIFKLIRVNSYYSFVTLDYLRDNFLVFINNDGFSISMNFIEIFISRDLSVARNTLPNIDDNLLENIFIDNLNDIGSQDNFKNLMRVYEMIPVTEISMTLDFINIMTIYEVVFDKHIEETTIERLYKIISECNINTTHYRKRSFNQIQNLLKMLKNSKSNSLSEHWIIWVFAYTCLKHSMDLYQDLYPKVLDIKIKPDFSPESISYNNKEVILETIENWEKDLNNLKLGYFDRESGVSFIYFWNEDDFANSFIANCDEVGLKKFNFDEEINIIDRKTRILYLARTIYKNQSYIGIVRNGLLTTEQSSELEYRISIFENGIEYKLQNFQILKYPEHNELVWVKITDGKIPSSCVSFDQIYCIARSKENQTYHYHNFNKNCQQNNLNVDILCYEEKVLNPVEEQNEIYNDTSSLKALFSQLSDEMMKSLDEYIDKNSDKPYFWVSQTQEFFTKTHLHCVQFCETPHHICIENEFEFEIDELNELIEECLLYLMLKLSGKLLRIQLFFYWIDRDILVKFLKYINFQSVVCLSIGGDLINDDIIKMITAKCDSNLKHIEFELCRNLSNIPFLIPKYENIVEFECDSRIISNSPLKFAKKLKSLKIGSFRDEVKDFHERQSFSVKIGLNEIQLLSNIYDTLSELFIIGLDEFERSIKFICHHFSNLTVLHLETNQKLDTDICLESDTLNTLQIYSSHKEENYINIDPLLQTIIEKCKNLENLEIFVKQIIIMSQSLVENVNLKTLIIEGTSKSQFNSGSSEMQERLDDENLIRLQSTSDEFVTFLNNSQLEKLEISGCRIIGKNLNDFDISKYLQMKTLFNTDERIYGNKTKYIDTIIRSQNQYKMSSYPRGQCVFIFNLKTADEGTNVKLQIDFMRLKKSFIELGFQIIECMDGTAQQIADTLRKCHEKCTKENDALVVYTSTIATNDSIFGRDMKLIKIEDILEMFTNDNCKKLQETPKIFFFDKHLMTIPDKMSYEKICVDFCVDSKSMDEKPVKMGPIWADIIIVEVEVPEHYGFSHVNANALMICLTDSLLTATDFNLSNIIKNTEEKVNTISNNEIMMRTTTRAWLKSFWFNYGYFVIEDKYKLMDTFFYFETKSTVIKKSFDEI